MANAGISGDNWHKHFSRIIKETRISILLDYLSDHPMSIVELHRAAGLNISYHTAWGYVTSLHKSGLIEKIYRSDSTDHRMRALYRTKQNRSTVAEGQ